MNVDTYARILENRKIQMKKKMLHNGISVALLGALLIGGANIFASCQRGFEEKNALGDGEPVEVSVGFSEDALTKSSVANVDAVNTVQIAAYRTMDGMLYDTANDPANLKLKLLAGYDYRIFSLVNCGASAVSWPQSLSQVEALSFTSASSTFTGGAPMAGDVTVTVNGNMSLTLTPKRMLSKWTVKFVDQDALGYEVKFVRMRHSASNATPWKYSEGFSSADGMTGTGASKATAVFDTGDFATSADVSAVTTSSGAVFYVMENARGTVSGFTGSAQMADLQASPEAATTYGLYTFLEIGLDFPAGADYERDPLKTSAEADVIYRVFLRKDAVNNLSVIRNTQMTLTLTGTRAGIDGTALDWSIEDNTVPSGNKITGTVTPVDWNTDMAGAGQTADHFTPTIYNLIVQDSGEAEWKKYTTMTSILEDESVMEKVCSSGKALWRLMSNLQISTDITAFEARVDELTTRAVSPLNLAMMMDNALSGVEGQLYFDKLAYSKTDARAYNTWYDFNTDNGNCWVEEENRAVTIFKGVEWYNNYYKMGSIQRGDASWASRRIIARSVLNGIEFFNGVYGGSESPHYEKETPYRASLCSIFLSNEGTRNNNGTTDKTDDTYPTYICLNTYLLKSEYRVPFGTIYAKANWSDRSDAGYNLVPGSKDMYTGPFQYFKNSTQGWKDLSSQSTSYHTVSDCPSGTEGAYKFSAAEVTSAWPPIVRWSTATVPQDRHLIVSCYFKTLSGTATPTMWLCLRDSENTLMGAALVESVNGTAYNSAHLVNTYSGSQYYGSGENVTTAAGWKRVTVKFTLTEAGAQRPLEFGLYVTVPADKDASVLATGFMVEPGTDDHGYVPYWNEGRGFSTDVTDVYTDKKAAWSAGCRWYAVTREASPDIEGNPNTAPYKHSWDWQPWTPVVSAM